jgi:nicotinamidase-related amidase
MTGRETMHSENGYRVYTAKDCLAATSIAAQDATLKHDFGMCSILATSIDVMNAMKTSPAKA